MTESRISIHDSIPHRGNMLLIDEVESLEGEEITCCKTFRPDEHFFDGHYPDYPIVPGVILCECAAQAAAVLLANGGKRVPVVEGAVPVLTRLNNVRFKRTVRPGDTIVVSARLDEVVSNAFFLSATIRLDEKVACSLELACTLAPRPTGE